MALFQSIFVLNGMIKKLLFTGLMKVQNRAEQILTILPPCLLPLHILRPAGLLFPLFLTQDVVNALSDLLGFFHFLFQRKIPPVERFPLGGQLGILRFPCLYRQGGLAVHHAFQIVVRRRE